MIRAGRQVSIKCAELQSIDGAIYAPIINLNGLILRADRELPTPIVDFFRKNNVLLNRIRYKGENIVILRGRYSLLASKIGLFINDNADLCSAQKEGLETIPPAIRLQREINESVFTPLPRPLRFGKREVSIPVQTGEEVLDIEAKGCIINNGRMSADQELKMKAALQQFAGVKLDGYGYMAEVISGKRVQCVGALAAYNAIIQAGDEVILESDESSESCLQRKIGLSLDDNDGETNWYNRPQC